MKHVGKNLNRAHYSVRDVSRDVASAFVEREHYSRSCGNVAVYRHGLFDIFGVLCGVAIWLPPTRAAAVRVLPEKPENVLSLTRLAVSKRVPRNGATFLLGRSIRMIRSKRRWEMLLTFADTWQNHDGTIYRASNWTDAGMTAPSKVWVDGTGKMMGAKRGPKNLTDNEMRAEGFRLIGKFPKFRYTYDLRRT